MLRLLVGLGNPGAKYRGTRHNAGFALVDRLAEQTGARLKRKLRITAEMAELSVQGGNIWAMKPLTYMNRSGPPVASFARSKGLAPEEILVVHDELDLPPGKARLKAGGGHGGHNGLRDIAEQLGSADFLRLRIGIGHPGDRGQVTPYVLSRPSSEERTAMEEAMDRSVEVLPDLLADNWDRACNHLHGPPASKS